MSTAVRNKCRLLPIGCYNFGRNLSKMTLAGLSVLVLGREFIGCLMYIQFKSQYIYVYMYRYIRLLVGI